MSSYLVESFRSVCFVIHHFFGVELVDEIRWETWVAGNVKFVNRLREGFIDADGLRDGVWHRQEVAD